MCFLKYTTRQSKIDINNIDKAARVKNQEIKKYSEVKITHKDKFARHKNMFNREFYSEELVGNVRYLL